MAHLVKANDGYHVVHNGEVVPVTRAFPNKFFVAPLVPSSIASYKAEIPQTVLVGLQFFDFPDGQKQKIGWNPYDAAVTMEVDPTKTSRSFTRYTSEQNAQRLVARQWIAMQFVQDAVRLDKLDTNTATLYTTQISDAISNDELDIFFTEKLLYDC
jgi:hypothetical protein